MKKYLIGALLFVPLLGTAAHAAPADEWVDNYSDDEAQDWYEFSQNVSNDSGADSDDSQRQNVESNRVQRGPTFVEDSESNDDSDVSGVSVLPIVGNDILNNADILSNVANDYSQRDDSRTTAIQTRSEDNDRNVSHTSIVDDSFNARDRAPVVVLDSPTRFVRTSGGGVGKLPTTGVNVLSPLALGLWLVIAGFWMIRTGKLRTLTTRASA